MYSTWIEDVNAVVLFILTSVSIPIISSHIYDILFTQIANNTKEQENDYG